MPRAVELWQQGRSEELWQMCCGYLDLSLEQFMHIQRRLLSEQLNLLNRSTLGRKIMRGDRPRTVEEFREAAPLTTYADYCPELSEKREAPLPAPPAYWAHTSGRSGDYPSKWVPITRAFAEELSTIMYGVGLLSSCKGRGDTSQMNERPKIVYTVAPRSSFPSRTGSSSAFSRHCPRGWISSSACPWCWWSSGISSATLRTR
jgi:hypothetical protein